MIEQLKNICKRFTYDAPNTVQMCSSSDNRVKVSMRVSCPEKCFSAEKLEAFQCKDNPGIEYQTQCANWAVQGACLNEQHPNHSKMQTHCRGTCEKAIGEPSQHGCTAWRESQLSGQHQCENDHTPETDCEKWADLGECKHKLGNGQINPWYSWMLTYCMGTCQEKGALSNHIIQSCPPLISEPQVNESGHCENKNLEMHPHTGASLCDHWRDFSQCAINPGYMHEYCKSSCGLC